MKENLTLSQLQKNIREVLSENFLKRVWVRCEIHELKVNYSGHCYLDLVEKGERDGLFVAKASGIVWNMKWKLISACFKAETGKDLAAGMKVLVQAQVQYSELYGLSLVIYDIDSAYTVGEAEMQRLKTLQRLKEEGMFDMNTSLPMPRLPRRFAVVSSANAAGYGDFVRHLNENGYGFRFSLELYNAPMQGETAPPGIVAALNRIMDAVDAGAVYDAVLLLRGGGSVADLSCFDDYELAAHIAQFPLPVMVAVGHDRDVHICDRVACVSVKTPTALADYILNIFAAEDALLSSLSSRLALSLREKFTDSQRRVDALSAAVTSALKLRYLNETARLDKWELRIRNGNPYEKMKSGYSMIYSDTGILVSASQVKEGDGITVMLKDGIVKCVVNQIEKK